MIFVGIETIWGRYAVEKITEMKYNLFAVVHFRR